MYQYLPTYLGGSSKRVCLRRRNYRDYETEANQLRSWRHGPSGQHIEFGNFGDESLYVAGDARPCRLNCAGSMSSRLGTVYDPFVCRGLEALIYAQYSGGEVHFRRDTVGYHVIAGGCGAHQSTVTPSLGAEIPRLDAYEPCFAQEVRVDIVRGTPSVL